VTVMLGQLLKKCRWDLVGLRCQVDLGFEKRSTRCFLPHLLSQRFLNFYRAILNLSLVNPPRSKTQISY